MAIAVTVDTVLGVPDVTQNEQIVQGTLTLSANYAAGGDPISFASQGSILSQNPPLHVEIYEEPLAATQAATGWKFTFLKGTTLANGKVAIINGITPFTTGAYSTTFATTTIKYRAWFTLGN